MPPAELPFTGYSVDSDAACGGGCWQRSFRASVPASTGNYFFSVRVEVFTTSSTGASFLAMQNCSFIDPARVVNSHEITAQVIGDGAKACRHNIGTDGNVVAYTYFTANRNVLIRVRSNPYYLGSDAEETAALVTVARQQYGIIERVAPR